MGDKSSEYMLAYIYIEKSRRMFEELSESNYENSTEILSKIPNVTIDKEKRLISPFEEIRPVEDEEEYIPKYILEIEESIVSQMEGIEEEMKIAK